MTNPWLRLRSGVRRIACAGLIACGLTASASELASRSVDGADQERQLVEQRVGIGLRSLPPSDFGEDRSSNGFLEKKKQLDRLNPGASKSAPAQGGSSRKPATPGASPS